MQRLSFNSVHGLVPSKVPCDPLVLDNVAMPIHDLRETKFCSSFPSARAPMLPPNQAESGSKFPSRFRGASGARSEQVLKQVSGASFGASPQARNKFGSRFWSKSEQVPPEQVLKQVQCNRAVPGQVPEQVLGSGGDSGACSGAFLQMVRCRRDSEKMLLSRCSADPS